MADPTKLKVCFLAGTLGRGGAERQLIYMLHALRQAGVSTRVLCLTQGEPFEREIRDLGVPIEWVGASKSRPIKLHRIVQALRRDPPHILQSTHFYVNLYTAVAARVVGIREIGAIRSDLIGEVKANGMMGWGHLFFPKSLAANSAFAQQKAVALGVSPDRIYLLRNAVGTRQRNAKKNPNERQRIQILFVGRLNEDKRADRFVRVVAKLVAQLPEQPLKARIAGDGLFRSDLLALADTLGLGPDRLELLGEQEDMEPLYREADLVILTSDCEGTPNVLLEAMAYGIPCVGTGVGGVPEIISDGRGFVAKPQDEDGLAAAARRLIVDAKLRIEIGRRGQEYVARYHSPDALQRQLMEIYDKILSSG